MPLVAGMDVMEDNYKIAMIIQEAGGLVASRNIASLVKCKTSLPVSEDQAAFRLSETALNSDLTCSLLVRSLMLDIFPIPDIQSSEGRLL